MKKQAELIAELIKQGINPKEAGIAAASFFAASEQQVTPQPTQPKEKPKKTKAKPKPIIEEKDELGDDIESTLKDIKNRIVGLDNEISNEISKVAQKLK